MSRSFGIGTCSRNRRVAHVLIGEPVPTSPEHALMRKALARRHVVSGGLAHAWTILLRKHLGDQLAAAAHSRLVEHGFGVLLGGLSRDRQRRGYARLRLPAQHVLGHLALARRQ